MAGPAKVHDALRPLTNGSGTYATIMKNLEATTGLVNLSIECQYDAGSDDYRQIPQMFDDFNQHGIEVAEIAFTPILARRGSDTFCGGMEEVEKYLFLRNQARQYGLNVGSSPPSNACMTDFQSIYVFDTDGSVIPCPALQGGEMAFGSVTTGIDPVAESQLLTRRLPDKCLNKCELLPACMGGCRLQALSHGGDFNGADCHYDTYRRLVEEYIRENVNADQVAVEATG
jgi:radical SAM protein with 4Fe4S-binding SPASM domain